MEENPSVLPQLAFKILEEIGESHKNQPGKISDDALLQLYAIFGHTLALATELLDNCKIIEYRTEDNCRRIYRIGNYKEFHTIYDQINFCDCQSFRIQVLENLNNLTCKHVLAVRLNELISLKKNCKIEIVTPSQFVEFLNQQLSHVDEEKEEEDSTN